MSRISVNNFDVLKEMSARDGDIHLAPLTNVISLRKVKQGTQITIGAEGDWVGRISRGEVVGGLILANKDEFDKIRAELLGPFRDPEKT